MLADALGIEPFLIPAPERDREALWEDRALLAENAWVTLQGGACSASRSRSSPASASRSCCTSPPPLRRAFYPLLVASQTIPIIVIAPILVVWFGFGIGPKLAIIALICFFPITVNTLDGLRSVDPDLCKLMRTLDAGRWQILRRVEAPTALPYFFSGAKIAVAVAVIGAVFGEWAGSDSGLGHLMLQASAQLLTARLFAAVVVLSAFAIALFGLLTLLERRVAWWGPDAARARDAAPASLARPRRAVALAAGCGEKEEPRRRRRAAAVRPRARLLRQPRPRRHLRGARARLLRPRRASTSRRSVPSDPSAPIKQVAAGQADLAISYEPEVMLARDQGLDVVAVGALVHEPLTSLISLPEAGIATPARPRRARRSPPPGSPTRPRSCETILERGRR